MTANHPYDAAEKPRLGKWQYSLRTLLLGVFIVALLFGGCLGGIRAYRQWKYPYGASHCCDKGLMFALHNYADANSGTFPTGGKTPEGSLSLLYPKYIDANTLRGKTIHLKVVEKILTGGKQLGPKTCGWHYVEGLTLNDDTRLALFWDKAGLDHNGGRLSKGGHTVFFVNYGSEYIPQDQWADFLENQRKLHAARQTNTKSGKPVKQSRSSAPKTQGDCE